MKTTRNNAPCGGFAPDLPEFLRGALPPGRQGEVEEHLRRCPSCSALARDFRAVGARLRQAPEESVPLGLADRVLARLDEERAAPWFVRFGPVIWRAAALVLCLLAAWVVFCAAQWKRPGSMITRAPAPEIEESVEWLLSAREPDGHWDAARWGAQRQYTVGINALALLALIRARPDLARDGAGPVPDGVDYLLSQQQPDGRLGPLASGTPYNHGMGTLALLEAYAVHQDPAWREALDRALGYIRQTQRESGGWGYPRETADKANTSISVWQIQALLRADELGWTDVRPALDRAMVWLAGVTGEDGRVGYRRAGDFPYGHETMTAAGALCRLLHDRRETMEQAPAVLRALYRLSQDGGATDYYRFYFLARALDQAGDAEALRLKADVQQVMLASLDNPGPEPWLNAGGRVYARAMTVLALQ